MVMVLLENVNSPTQLSQGRPYDRGPPGARLTLPPRTIVRKIVDRPPLINQSINPPNYYTPHPGLGGNYSALASLRIVGG